MAVDFNILARVPTIGSQIMAGQEAGREAAARNMLLQQRQMEFQQAQEDRQRRLREEQIFDQAAELIRKSGLDPDDPKVLQQFTAAAVQSRNPQLMSLATSMSERLAKRRQERSDAAAVAAIAARRRGEAPAGAPASAEAALMPEAPAAAAAPPVAMPEAPPPEVSSVAQEQAAYQRPYFYGQGQFTGAEPTGVASPIGAGVEPVRTDLPAQDMYADLAAANKLAPPAPPINAMLAPPPAPAPAPAVQVAGPAAMPAAPKVDVGRLQKQLDDLQEEYDEYSGLGTEAGRKAAAALKPQMGRLERQIRDANKTKESQSPLMRDVVAFGFEPTAEGLAKFEAAKRDPDTVGIKEYNLAVRQGFKGSLFDYKKELRSTVEVKLPEQEKAFETELGKGQAKKLIDDKAVADDARSIIDTVQQGRQLLQSGMITGFGAEALTQIGAALNQAGISFASDSVANTQAFAANMAQNVGRIIKQFGAGTGLSNADREYAEKMAGGKITLDRKAIERILDINERAARNVITAHNKRVAGVKTNVPLTVELPPEPPRPAAIPTAPAAVPAAAPAATPAAAQPIYARNPTTNERIMSTDGGRTWSPAR